MKLGTFTYLLASLILVFSKATTAEATIYLVAKDPSTQTIGVASISSGFLDSAGSPDAQNSMVSVGGLGIIGWSGMPPEIDPTVNAGVFDLMKTGATEQEIEKFVLDKIEGKYLRFVFASTGLTIGMVSPQSGCGTPECGSMTDPSGEYLMIAGDVNASLVPRAMALYAPIHNNTATSLRCRLLLGYGAILAAGGERRPFQSASLGLDRAGAGHFENYFTIRAGSDSQKDMIDVIRSQIEAKGDKCPPDQNLGR